jgi:hypothetical protein
VTLGRSAGLLAFGGHGKVIFGTEVGCGTAVM